MTFLFTDIEGSTRLWPEKPEAMAVSNARHDEILRAAIESSNGHVDDSLGLAWSLMNKARIAQNKGEAAEMRMYLAKLNELIQQSPVSRMAGMFYFTSAMRVKTHANCADAKAYLEDSLIAFKQIRNKNFVVSVKTELGHSARYTGRMDETKAIYYKARIDWQDCDNRGAEANLFECFALVAVTKKSRSAPRFSLARQKPCATRHSLR